jgi:uncharacterized protein (DUF1697 family)
MSKTYLALLRGINLGPKNKIPMPDLSTIFEESGCENVRTYIQSGNVIFRATRELAAKLPKLVTDRIQKVFGYQVPIILRTTQEMQEAVASNPFLKLGAPEDKLHVMFLANLPDTQAVTRLDPDRSPPDRFEVRRKEVHLLFPEGLARSKLTTQYFDSKLGTIGTVRGWRTVTKLLELMVTQ